MCSANDLAEREGIRTPDAGMPRMTAFARLPSATRPPLPTSLDIKKAPSYPGAKNGNSDEAKRRMPAIPERQVKPHPPAAEARRCNICNARGGATKSEPARGGQPRAGRQKLETGKFRRRKGCARTSDTADGYSLGIA